MNGYARVSQVQADVNGSAGNAELEATYVRAIEEASREVDSICRRPFYAELGTRHFDGPAVHMDATQLWFDADLLAVSALALDLDGDRVYESPLAAADYELWPWSGAQKWRIDLTPGGARGRWPCARRAIQVTGTWGYSYEVEAVGLTGTLASAADTSLACTATAQGVVDAGETLVMGDEQLYASDVSGATITVERGVNGTTAAEHSAVAIQRRRYPRPVERATRLLVVKYRWGLNEGPGGGASFGDELVRPQNFASFGEIAGLLRPFTAKWIG